MKKILLTLLITALLLSASNVYVFSQNDSGILRSDSDPLIIQLGDAPTTTSSSHVCPVQATFIPWPRAYTNIGEGQMSWSCEHCHDELTYRSIDMGTYPAGSSPVVAIVNGTAEKLTPPRTRGRSIQLVGDDGVLYFYAHLKDWAIPDGVTRVTAGQVIGSTATASDTASANQGVAHLHIQATNNGDNYRPNIYIGPLLDQWCGVNACIGGQKTCGH